MSERETRICTRKSKSEKGMGEKKRHRVASRAKNVLRRGRNLQVGKNRGSEGKKSDKLEDKPKRGHQPDTARHPGGT